MALDLGAFEAGLEAALESRDGAIDSPHHSLLLTRRDAQGAPTGLALGLGHVRVDWNRFTFERERLRGARLDLALPRAGAGPPRLGVELAYGDDAPDYVRLGNRTGPVDPPSARLGGMRAYWRPSSRVATALTFAWREDDEDTSPGGYRG